MQFTATSCPNVLTVHAFKAQDETNEVLQCYVSRGVTVAQSHQIQYVITDPQPCQKGQKLRYDFN